MSWNVACGGLILFTSVVDYVVGCGLAVIEQPARRKALLVASLVATYRNLMLTMLLGGLWHGASWNFVCWGGLHGAALAVHRAWRELGGWTWVEQRRLARGAWAPVSRLLTLGVVLAGWILFRAQDFHAAAEFFSRLATWTRDGTRLASPFLLPAVLAVAFVHWWVGKDSNWAEEIPQRSIPVRILSYGSLLLLIVCLGATDASPLIYFQF
jgi:alginate O-acetyltransferase complex protein AlgI